MPPLWKQWEAGCCRTRRRVSGMCKPVAEGRGPHGRSQFSSAASRSSPTHITLCPISDAVLHEVCISVGAVPVDGAPGLRRRPNPRCRGHEFLGLADRCVIASMPRLCSPRSLIRIGPLMRLEVFANVVVICFDVFDVLDRGDPADCDDG